MAGRIEEIEWVTLSSAVTDTGQLALSLTSIQHVPGAKTCNSPMKDKLPSAQNIRDIKVLLDLLHSRMDQELICCNSIGLNYLICPAILSALLSTLHLKTQSAERTVFLEYEMEKYHREIEYYMFILQHRQYARIRNTIIPLRHNVKNSILFQDRWLPSIWPLY